MKKRLIAVIVMIALILVALPIGVYSSLEPKRAKADGHYYYDDSGFAIYQGINEREEAARNLIKIAEKYKEDNHELIEIIDDLDTATSKSENTFSNDRGKQAEVNKELGRYAEELADALEKIDLDERDEKYPKKLIAEMESQQKKIEHSSYNEMAREFNDMMDSFPTNIIGGVVGIKPLELFE